MIIHVDPDSGSPLFVMDQIMMIRSLNTIYHKYGIHGIYYAVFFGWSGSPFATITNEEEKHDLIAAEVYGKPYYDPIQKEEVSQEKLRNKDQYKKPDMQEAIQIIGRLARVPVLEDKISYLRWLDDNTKAMDQPINKQNPMGIQERAKKQGELVKGRKEITALLDEAIERERNLLTKKDVLCSLSDFIMVTTEKFS